MLQPNNQSRLATLSLIESFRQVALKSNDLSVVDLGMSELNNSANTPSRSHCTSFKLPTKLRNSLASMGLVCSENSEYIGPLGNVQGTGFGKVFVYLKKIYAFLPLVYYSVLLIIRSSMDVGSALLPCGQYP